MGLRLDVELGPGLRLRLRLGKRQDKTKTRQVEERQLKTTQDKRDKIIIRIRIPRQDDRSQENHKVRQDKTIARQ